MVKSNIAVYARIRPLSDEEIENGDTLSYKVMVSEDGTPRAIEFSNSELKNTYINKYMDKHTFYFTRVFDETSTQDEIYKIVAKPALYSVLDGYNSTLFAYGQTGSGKTYTLTGGDFYKDRGIVPRTLTSIYEEFKKRDSMSYSIKISYIEIYNEEIFDLLDPSHSTKKLEKWERIKIREDKDGGMSLVNMRLQEALSEADALNLFFLGNVNRVTSDTPMNRTSSRSHCIFTITVEGKNTTTDLTTLSKLHLVDLAGSERVYKQEHSETTKKEGKYINLSLHYLEQVIISLYEMNRGKRVHIPYRNSVMTSILRDSLGGNYKTVFITTLNPQSRYCDESISTCRFAERCSMIEHEVVVNSEVDLLQRIQKLENENRELKRQLRSIEMNQGICPPVLTEMNMPTKQRYQSLVSAYLKSQTDYIPLKNLNDAHECISLLRDNALYAVDLVLKEQNTNKQLNSKIIEQDNKIKQLENELDQIYKYNPIVPPSPSAGDNNSNLLVNTPLYYKTSIASSIPPPLPKHTDPILSSELMDEYLNTMITQGTVFLKYKQNKPPETRLFFISQSLDHLMWKNIEKNDLRGDIKLASIETIMPGCCTPSFDQRKDITPAKCFSLVLKGNKTVDLQIIDSLSNHIEESDCRFRDLWCQFFGELIDYNKKQINETHK